MGQNENSICIKTNCITWRYESCRFDSFPQHPGKINFPMGLLLHSSSWPLSKERARCFHMFLRACAPLSHHLSSTSKILLELVSPCFDHCDTFSVEFSGSIDKKESDDEIRRRDLFPIVVIQTRILKRKKLLLPVSVDSWFDWILCCNIALHNFQLRLDQCF